MGMEEIIDNQNHPRTPKPMMHHNCSCGARFNTEADLALHQERAHLDTNAKLVEKGFAQAKMENLVSFILSRFQDPNNWPMTDAERISLLRDIYQQAKAIKP